MVACTHVLHSAECTVRFNQVFKNIYPFHPKFVGKHWELTHELNKFIIPKLAALPLPFCLKLDIQFKKYGKIYTLI